TLSKNKLRTFLTGLSVASGIFILVILLGFGTGIENGVKSEFEDDASNYISVWTGVTTKEYKGMNPGRYVQLKNEDYLTLSNQYEAYTDKKSATYWLDRDRKSTRLNSSHVKISYAVFCLKKKTQAEKRSKYNTTDNLKHK